MTEVSPLDGERIQISREMSDAVDSGAIDRVVALIDAGEHPDAVNSLGESALLKAAWNGDIALSKALLQRGASVSLAAEDGRTPLYSATVSGNLALVQLLLG